MTLESDAKFEEKLTRRFKNDMKNLVDFHHSTLKFQNFDFDGFFSSKVKKYTSLKFSGSYVHWQLRMTQNLKWNWVVSWNLTWDI